MLNILTNNETGLTYLRCAGFFFSLNQMDVCSPGKISVTGNNLFLVDGQNFLSEEKWVNSYSKKVLLQINRLHFLWTSLIGNNKNSYITSHKK